MANSPRNRTTARSSALATEPSASDLAAARSGDTNTHRL
jgi:hypothetical protein